MAVQFLIKVLSWRRKAKTSPYFFVLLKGYSIMLLPSEIFKIMFLLIYSVWMIRSLQVSMLSGKEMWKTTESYLMILSWKLTITSLAALVSQPSFAIIKIKKSALVSSFGGGLVVSDALLYFKLWWEMTEERQTDWHIKI